MNLLGAIQWCTRRLGYDLVPYNAAQHPLPRRQRLIEHYRIDTVLDVGANTGQFARELRASGYRGRIVSFEPLSEAFAHLQTTARGDAAWRLLNVALGDVEGEQRSIRPATRKVARCWICCRCIWTPLPTRATQVRRPCEFKRWTAVFQDVCAGARSIYMKVDTQGYEAHVLRGAARSLDRIDTIQIEMSLAPLYAGQALFADLYADLTGRGYALVGVENNFGDARTGHLLQIDGIFRREPAGPR